MRIASINVNGIRAATRRGFSDWLKDCRPDVVALQEMRCQPEQLPQVFDDYYLSMDAGTLPGRNGVAIMTRQRPKAVRTWSGRYWRQNPSQIGSLDQVSEDIQLAEELTPFAETGRWIEVDLGEKNLCIASLYLPKGDTPFTKATGGEKEKVMARYERKMAFLKGFNRQLAVSRENALSGGREFLVMGDFNIAHTELDLKNWRANHKSSGFLPEEREWFSTILYPETLVDVIRLLHPDEPGPYSWWSWRGQAYTNNAGWRIDYHLATPNLASSATRAWVDNSADYNSRLSDHSPVLVEYNI